jgi:flagellum-specific peptidoglycan hydrolase FlgJ
MGSTNNSHRSQQTVSQQAILDALGRNWFKGVLLGLGIYILFFKDISIQFNLNSAQTPAVAEQQSLRPEQGRAQVLPAAMRGSQPPEQSPRQNVSSNPIKWDPRGEADFSNLTFVLRPDYAEQHRIRPEVVEAKIKKCEDYVEEFKRIAIREMEEKSIPASITLAQGLLESNAGESDLATESNNHFGIKCRSKCRGCTCRNYSDDDIYDMFRVFESVEASFQEHSKLLNSARYRHLLDLRVTDYRGWARGLKKAGYATDKHYADKLIQIIEFLELDQYDRLGA